jgi:chromosome segregation ATPase
VLSVVVVLLLWSLGFAFFWSLLAVNRPEDEPQVPSTLRRSKGYRLLPRHDTPDDWPADLRGRRERFVARVAAHEQRHIDIYPEDAKAMKARLEATRTAVSCADLEKAIDAEWRTQYADIERAQTEFDAVDETTARSEREALQARLDGTRARLEPVDAEIRRLDTELASLRRRVDAGRADLVAQHNALAGRRVELAEEYNRLVADANDVIDALNWARW